jgi:membrane-associated phospholipid phosphatase
MHPLHDDHLWPFAGTKPVLILVAGIVATLIFFNLFPQVDIAVSRLFFVEVACSGAGTVCGEFPAASLPVIGKIRDVLQAGPVVLAVALLGLVAWRLVRSRSWANPFDRAALAAVAALVLGAGALVNMILKEFWGRPRPVATDLFGGPFPFVPAGRISDHCLSNCSFVSGEVAGSFWLVALACLAPRRFRAVAIAVALVVATATAVLRIAFGGHYLSDVIMAGLLSLLVFSLIATTMRYLSDRPADADRAIRRD